MKYICHFYFLLSIFVSYADCGAQAQEVLLFNSGVPNHLYAGINNPINCLIENVSCNNVAIKANKGAISRIGECDFTYRSDSSGTVIFSVYHVKKGKEKLVASFERYILPFPTPVANVGGYSNGSAVMLKAFKAQGGVVAVLIPGLGFDIKFIVTEFTVTIIADGVVTFHQMQQGNAFTPRIRASFDLLETSDRVLISGIKVIGPGRQVHLLPPLEYTMY
jgi:hypothetical protein